MDFMPPPPYVTDRYESGINYLNPSKKMNVHFPKMSDNYFSYTVHRNEPFNNPEKIRAFSIK